MTTIELKWFKFRQNNSGGYFKAPAVEVFIEALDEAGAEARANFIGLSNADSCSCCGDRWNGCSEETPPDVADIDWMSPGMYTGADFVFARKYAYGDDAGVVLSTKVMETPERYRSKREVSS